MRLWVHSQRLLLLLVTLVSATPLLSPVAGQAPIVIDVSALSKKTGPPSGRNDSLDTAGVGNPTSNGCADIDMSAFGRGRACGSPLSLPCFDHRRCRPPPEGLGPTVYVYDVDCSLANSYDMATTSVHPRPEDIKPGTLFPLDPKQVDVASAWRAAAKNAGVLAETYDTACVFIHVNTVGSEPCAVSAPLWNGGANHLMVDYTDKPRNARPTVAQSYAMEAASNSHSCYYRSDYDMSVPLFPHKVFPELEGVAPDKREFFATVKGSVYLSRRGSEERMAVVPLHDPAHGVVSAMHCFELHGEHLLPNNADFCQRLKGRYDDYSYGRLMNSTFGLVPAGRSPGVFRLAEVMSAGAIPVFIGRELVPPFRERFNWDSFSFFFSPDQVGTEMIRVLRAVPPEALQKMQRKSLEAYWKIFGGTTCGFETIARNIVDELIQRVTGYYHPE